MPSSGSSLPLLDAAQAQAGDREAVAAGDTWDALMQRAAGHLARGVVAAAGGRIAGRRVVLLVGKGNNGGDGWAAARRLAREHGAHCIVVAVDGTDTPGSDEALANRAAWIAAGGRTVGGTDHLDAVLADAEVVVDCLLGTGARGAPRGAAGEAVAALARCRESGGAGPGIQTSSANNGPRPGVVACDIPSGVDADSGAVAPGVDADTGAVVPGAVVADVTVTFGALKRGLLLHPGAAHAGRVLLGSLGPAYDRFAATASRWSVLTPSGAAPELLPAAADKRARGVLLAVAGALGTGGAAALTAAGALRAGAGLVTLATPDPVRTEVAGRLDAGIMLRGLPAEEQGGLHRDAIHALPALPSAPGGAVVAGPGLGVGHGAAEVVAALRARAGRLVLDADALNVHRDAPGELAEHVGSLVLTPHERELARIGGGEDGADAWANRVERVPELAARYDATIVAKGPGTLVAAPDGRVWVCPVGGPALGSGGTGDVLAGVIGAAVAAVESVEAVESVDGVETVEDAVPLAVARAVWWHAAAGVLAGENRGGRATASDLLEALPGVMGLLSGGAGDATAGAAAAGVPAAGGAGTDARTGPAGVAARAGWGALPWEPWTQQPGGGGVRGATPASQRRVAREGDRP